jgi:hypothetical protein
VPFGFLKRGDKDKRAASGHPAPGAPSGKASRGFAFDGLTEEWRLVGRMEIDARLTDVLNRREAIGISDVRWAPVDGSEELTPAPGLERIDPFDLIVVFAGVGSLPSLSDAERLAHKLHKVAYDVALEVPPFRVIGTVYLFPGSEPERLMDRSTELFVPVTDAVALLGQTVLNDPEVDVVLVNRSYLRGVEQIDRRTVEATRALLGHRPDEGG